MSHSVWSNRQWTSWLARRRGNPDRHSQNRGEAGEQQGHDGRVRQRAEQAQAGPDHQRAAERLQDRQSCRRERRRLREALTHGEPS